ncbi:MAG: hypothetical protein OEM97_06635 [Acidimicrobiia bacterium]|nr:hypothetical protein [Acidimicrobiia bacterium]
MRRSHIAFVLVLALVLFAGLPASATSNPFPDVIDLPGGFFPEGIAVGSGTTFYTGSLVDGAIYRGDLRTGSGDVWVEGQEGLLAVGMDFDRRSGNLLVAGGPSGTIRVYDGVSGALVADVFLEFGFINDVIVTEHAAYLTNSFAPELYEVALDRQGNLTGDVRTIPLSGDFEFIPDAFNANGIEARRDTLIVVNSAVGALYLVDRTTGEASLIDLGGEVVNGDGLVVVGQTLYAVIGGLNQITEIRLSGDLSRGQVTDIITDGDFDVPTTAARFGRGLYAVNAKFGTPVTPDTPYEVVRVDR